MGCGCGKGTAQQKLQYVVTAPNGTSKTYHTEVEARAAVTRLGGGAIQKVPAR